MGLSYIRDWSSAFPFLNLAKQARPWIAQRPGKAFGKGGRLDLDKHGWIKRLDKHQYADLLFLTPHNKHIPYNQFRVTFDGHGVIQYQGSVSLIKDNGNTHIIKLINNKKHAILRIRKTNPSDYVRNIEIVPLKYAEIYDKGEIFNPDWLRLIKNYRAIRFMNWMQTSENPPGNWEDRPKPNDANWQKYGVPIEIMVKLANKINADPWFNIPHTADDEYIVNFGKYLQKNLDRKRKVIIEHSNEIWNFWFPQAKYANKLAKKRWNKNNLYMEWHGMRTQHICHILKTKVFNTDSHRVVCVLGLWTNNPALSKTALECPHWVQEGHKPCYQHDIDAIAITGYFSGCLHGQRKRNPRNQIHFIRKWIREGEAGIKKAFEQLRTGKYFDCFDTLKEVNNRYHTFYKIAKFYNLRLFAYEGGSHITALGKKYENDPDIIRFLRTINRRPEIYDIYLKNFENWKNSGGELFMHYVEVSLPSRSGNFGAMEHLLDFEAPKYKALIKFNKSLCWWENC